METYRVHYGQINEGWIEVEAGTKKSAIKKAQKELRDFTPNVDAVELPNGEQESIYE